MTRFVRSPSGSRVGAPPTAAAPDRGLPAPAGLDGAVRVLVLGGFRLVRGRSSAQLSRGSQRLVAFLALQAGPTRRDFAAGLLWPHVSEARAHASLRSGLARLGEVASVAVAADAVDVSLVDEIQIDLGESQAVARRLLEPGAEMTPAAAARAIPLLSAELLPGWYDDWALLEAESWRQLRLHALEAAAALLVGARQFGDAAQAAVAAVHADPLRESARGALIGVHLAEGNQSEALREFQNFQTLLRAELGLEPTAKLRATLPGARGL